MPTEIPNLGGSSWNTPTAINDRGQVVGFSDLPNDDPAHPNYHAFLWTRESGTRDLGTLGTATRSIAYSINSQGQIVGGSGARAFLWQNDVLTDLNTLIQPGSCLILVYANDINDRGEIAGQAYDQTTGEFLAFLAIPRHHRDGKGELSTAQPEGHSEKVVLPVNVQRQLQLRPGLGGMDLGR